MRIIVILAILISAYNVALSQHWEVADSSLVSTSRFDDISFIDGVTGYTGQNGNMYRTDDQGLSWSHVGVILPNIYIRSIEYVNENLGFVGTLSNASSGGGLFRTNDGGATYTHVNPTGPNKIYEVCGLDHLGDLVIGVGAYSEPAYFYKSTDLGMTWQATKIEVAGGLVECIILDEMTYLVSGISPNDQFSRAIILKTIDGGSTWREVALADEPMTYTWKMHINESGIGLASIENSENVFLTNDFGDNWEVFKVGNKKEMFGGIALLDDQLGWVCNQWGSGIFETQDGGLTWHEIPNGFNINKIITINNDIALASGRYIYRYDRNKINVRPEPNHGKFHEMHVGPIPAADQITIALNLLQSSRVRLDLVHVNGTRVQTIYNAVMGAGAHHLEVDVDNVPAGTYVVWLRTNEGHLQRKVVILGH